MAFEADIFVPAPPDLRQFGELVYSNREQALLHLLGAVDFAYAQDSGLFDLFAYDEEIGVDGIFHVLGGELKTSRRGGCVPKGFHHEPSAALLWPHETYQGKVVPSTRVEYIVEFPSNEVCNPSPRLMEPYQGGTIIGGYRKMGLRRIKNELVVQPAISSMFPREYDVLSVLQSIRIAHGNRDTANEELQIIQGARPVVQSRGRAPLIDGVSDMVIRMTLDYETAQVITAMPVMAETDVMNLNKAQLERHITYGLGGDKQELIR